MAKQAKSLRCKLHFSILSNGNRDEAVFSYQLTKNHPFPSLLSLLYNLLKKKKKSLCSAKLVLGTLLQIDPELIFVKISNEEPGSIQISQIATCLKLNYNISKQSVSLSQKGYKNNDHLYFILRVLP